MGILNGNFFGWIEKRGRKYPLQVFPIWDLKIDWNFVFAFLVLFRGAPLFESYAVSLTWGQFRHFTWGQLKMILGQAKIRLGPARKKTAWHGYEKSRARYEQELVGRGLGLGRNFFKKAHGPTRQNRLNWVKLDLGMKTRTDTFRHFTWGRLKVILGLGSACPHLFPNLGPCLSRNHV